MEIGDQLPSLHGVTDDDGRPLNWRDARRNRIVFFTHQRDCTKCSSQAIDLLELRARLAQWDGDLWLAGGAVTPDVDGICVTGDAEHRLRQRCGLLPDDATVVVADRWGQIWLVASTDDRHVLVDPADVLETTKFIALQCPECETLDQPAGDWSSVH